VTSLYILMLARMWKSERTSAGWRRVQKQRVQGESLQEEVQSLLGPSEKSKYEKLKLLRALLAE
ncbi:unnamed protein product, partial [Effrenium voratum]